MKVNVNKAIEFLLARGNLPILFWLKKDILEVPTDREYRNLQKYASRIRIVSDQKANGGWCKKRYETHPRWENTYYIVDTLQSLIYLYNYGCTLDDKEMKKGVKFLFSTQTSQGDFRGAYLNEYAPTYHSLTLEVLSLLGLHDDERLQKGYRWLIDIRQDDGGWVIPYRTIDKDELKKRYNFEAQLNLDPIDPDRQQPSSHLVTGMALRAIAASPKWRRSKEARRAGELISGRFFKEDLYEDRKQALYWEELTYPFWATDILSSLDSLSKIGFSSENEAIKSSLQWLLKRQHKSGYWQSGLNKATLEDHLWVTLSVLRVLKRFGILSL